MNEMITIDTTQRMTSRDIAEIMAKRHDHVLRDIDKLIREEAINAPRFGLVKYTDKKGEERPMYELDFQATMTLITGYDAVRRSMVIDRWVKLETGQAKPLRSNPRTSQVRDELDKAHAQIELLQDKILAQVPMWAKIKKYTELGLSRKEICLLCGRHKDTIRVHIRRMEACGLIDPPKDLARLQAGVSHLICLSGGAR